LTAMAFELVNSLAVAFGKILMSLISQLMTSCSPSSWRLVTPDGSRRQGFFFAGIDSNLWAGGHSRLAMLLLHKVGLVRFQWL
jgi:hypothetical protein